MTATKPARTMRFIAHENGVHILALTVGKQTSRYFCQRIPADFGVGVRLEKFGAEGGDSYDVNIDHRSSCECRGFCRHGRCKHVDACKKLLAEGKLPEAE